MAVAWTGAASVETDPDGWTTFWRVPRSARATIPDDRFWQVASTPAGVCARWQVNAAALTIEVRGTPGACPIDVLVDGVLYQRLAVGPSAMLHRVELPVRPASVEVWLSQSGVVQVREVGFVDGVAVADLRERRHWIAYGSSITECAGAAGPSETWPALVAREFDTRLTCLGFGGQCHIDPLIARSIRDTPADLISLCLGINIYNRSTFAARTLRPQVAGFIQTIRDGHSDTPIVVITPIASLDREGVENAVGLTLRAVRDEIGSAVCALRDLGDDNLHLVDGRSALAEQETREYLSDGLHPSAAGYRLMAGRLAPVLGRHLADLNEAPVHALG